MKLVYHPPVLTVGVGCERGASAEEVTALVRDTLASAGLAEQAVAALCSIDVKMDEPAIHAAAAKLGVPVRFFDAARLEEEAPASPTRPTSSSTRSAATASPRVPPSPRPPAV